MQRVRESPWLMAYVEGGHIFGSHSRLVLRFQVFNFPPINEEFNLIDSRALSALIWQSSTCRQLLKA